MNPIIAVFSVAFALLFTGFSAGSDKASLSATAPLPMENHTAAPAFRAQVDDIIRATNRARKRKGYAALKKNQKLMEAAQFYAQLMAREDEMSHSVRNQSLKDRARHAGYSYRKLSENIALNSQLEGSFVVNEQWMKSTGHRKNILTADISEIGVAVAGPSRKGLYYYCQIFGKPL